MKKILIGLGLLLGLSAFGQVNLRTIKAPLDTLGIIIDDTTRYEFKKDTFSAPDVYFDFSNAGAGGGSANLTDSTLILSNTALDSIKIQLDTSYFYDTRVKVKELSIGGGDLLTSSDTINIDEISQDIQNTELDSLNTAKINSKNDSLVIAPMAKFNNDTMLFENFNRVYGIDSSYHTNKSWTWIRNID